MLTRLGRGVPPGTSVLRVVLGALAVLAFASVTAVAVVRANHQVQSSRASTASQPPASSTAPTDAASNPSASSAVTGPVRGVAVTSFGAVPDDGRDDATAIDRALASSQTVVFPKGRYDIRAQSVRPRSGQRLVFQSGAFLAAAPFIPAAGSTKADQGIEGSYNRAALEIVGVHDVLIENVGIYGSRDVHPSGQLMGVNVLGHARDITFRGGHIWQVSGDGRGHTMGDGIYVGTTDTLRRTDPSVPQNVRIEGLLIEGSDRQGVAAVEVRRLTVTGSVLRHNRAAGVDVEPNFARGVNEDVVIAGSTFDDNGLGVNISDFAKRTRILRNTLSVNGKDPRADNISTLGRDTEIRGNHIRGGHHCVYVAGLAGQDGYGVGGAIGSVVADNDMAGCAVGVRVSARDTTVSANSIARMTDWGVVLDGSLPTERARGSKVTGNRLTDCSRPGTEFSVSILAADALRTQITGNQVTDDRGTLAADYGIQLNGVVTERETNIVSGNQVKGTVKGGGIYTPDGRTFG